MANVIEIDARELEHPVPFERVVKAFAQMGEMDLIHMIHRKNPLPLYDFLDRQPMASYRTEQSSDGVWHIFICKKNEFDMKGFDV